MPSRWVCSAAAVAWVCAVLPWPGCVRPAANSQKNVLLSTRRKTLVHGAYRVMTSTSIEGLEKTCDLPPLLFKSGGPIDI